ncbi:competence protein [Flavobacterium sp.]|uniref:competence protein n=1 Tax=Flavobacterium sp. TaxID=239 RepID=UPI0025C6DA27|nr:competence protein [Flavobacterium sp.]MBA4152945.1 competence protein [Flavobacterium sp.]
MAFEEINENVNQIQEETKAYLDSSAAYYKLWGFKVAMKSASTIIKFSLVAICLSMVLLFGSIAGAIALGYALDNFAYGFLIVSGIYLLITLALFLLKDKIVEGPVMAKFSEIFFND